MKLTHTEKESLARALIRWAEVEAATRDLVKWKEAIGGEVVFYDPSPLRFRRRGMQ